MANMDEWNWKKVTRSLGHINGVLTCDIIKWTIDKELKMFSLLKCSGYVRWKYIFRDENG